MFTPAISTCLRIIAMKSGGISTSTSSPNSDSIAVYNENRRLIRELYKFRADRPWQAPAAEVYLMVRAGLVLPVEEHTVLLREYLVTARAEERPMRDNCRIVL